MYLVISLYLVQLGFRVNCLGYGLFVFIYFFTGKTSGSVNWYLACGYFVSVFMAQLWFLEIWVGFRATALVWAPYDYIVATLLFISGNDFLAAWLLCK